MIVSRYPVKDERSFEVGFFFVLEVGYNRNRNDPAKFEYSVLYFVDRSFLAKKYLFSIFWAIFGRYFWREIIIVSPENGHYLKIINEKRAMDNEKT